MRDEADAKPSCWAISSAWRCSPIAYGERFSSTEPACDDALSDFPAPETPDFASITALVVTARAGRVPATLRSRSSRDSRSAVLAADRARAGRSSMPRAPSRTRLRATAAREPVRSGEVDDDARRRRLECGRSVVREAEEEDVGSAAAASAFVTNGGTEASSRGSSGRALAGERIGAERDQLELRVREHPVERLLAGVAGLPMIVAAHP